MNSALKIRWIVVSAIWSAAIALTCWNDQTVAAIAALRQENEHRRAEYSFQRRHANVLATVAAQDDRLYLSVDSPQLGLIQMGSRLEDLAASSGLNDVVLRNDLGQVGNEQMPYHLDAAGPLKNVVQFLTALQRYPFIIEKNTRIRLTDDEGGCALEMRFYVRFRIEKHRPEDGPAVVVSGRLPLPKDRAT